MLKKCLIKPKLQEILPYNQAAWKRGKGIVRRPANLRGSCATGKVPSPWEVLSLARGSASTKKELHRLREEGSCWFAAGRTDRDLLRRSWPSHNGPRSETCTCWCPQGQGAVCKVTQASGDRTGDRTGTGCTEIAVKGWRVVQANTRDGHRKEPTLSTEAPRLTSTLEGGARPTCAATFSLCSQWAKLCLYEGSRHPPATLQPHQRLPTLGSGAEIQASPQGLSSFSCRTEAWVSQQLRDPWIWTSWTS